MKDLDLNGLGVQEMNAVEMKQTEGGNPIALLVVAAVLAGIITDWSGFKKGLVDGFSAVN